MKCDVAICGRNPDFEVRFAEQNRRYFFCYFHTYDQRGQPRWRLRQIEQLERL